MVPASDSPRGESTEQFLRYDAGQTLDAVVSMACVYWLFDETCICPRLHGYVGITVNARKRFAEHRRTRKIVFKTAILFEGDREACLSVERELRPDHGIGWNRVRGGAHDSPAGSKPTLSDEHRKRLAELARARFAGKPKSQEQRQKMRETALAAGGHGPKKHSAETRAKLSEFRKGNQYAIGLKHSDEVRARISAAQMGNQNWKKRKPYSAAVLAKMREGGKRRWANVASANIEGD